MRRCPLPLIMPILLAVLLAALPGSAALPDGGVSGSCTVHFAGGTAPVLVNQRLVSRTRGLCNRAFATLHSGLTRTPLYSAEHLTAAGLEAARDMRRVNTFHPDDRLPAD